MNFDLEQLRAFDAVMRLRNFRAAAEVAGTAQSSLSHQIGRLETQLGRKLFTRTTRRVEPTADGRALLAYARSMLAIADETRRQFESPPVAGVLRLGIVEDFALGELHRVLGLFRRQYPRFHLSLTTGLSAHLFRGLDADELDVVMAKRLPGRSQGRLLYARDLVWCGDPASLGSGVQDSVPIVTYVEPSSVRRQILDAMHRAGRSHAIVAESAGMAGIQAAVVAGFGVTAFSDGFIPPAVAPLTSDYTLPALDGVEYVIDQRARPRSQAVDAFIDLLFATIAALAEPDHEDR